MPTPVKLMLLLLSINLVGCQQMAGNVIPDTGPTMEHIYDSMGVVSKSSPDIHALEKEIVALREEIKLTLSDKNTYKLNKKNAQVYPFRKLPNPELALYVFPHLAGSYEVPIPGYYTAFHAYEKDHYALPQEYGQ